MNTVHNNLSPFSVMDGVNQKTIGISVSKYDTISVDEARKIYEHAMNEAILAKYNFPSKPSSDGYYHIQVSDSSKASGRRQIKAKTLPELKEKVLAHESGVNGSKRKTFKEVFELTQEEKLKYVKNSEKLLSVKNTVSKNYSEYRRYFDGTSFEKLFIDDISKKDIEEVCLLNLRRYDMYSKSFLSMRSILSGVLRLAYNEYWISDNPYARMDFAKFKDMLSNPAPVDKRLHNDKEIEQMLSFMHSKQQERPNLVSAYALELQLLTGMRRGEIPPLEVSDILDGYISISKEQLTVLGDEKHFGEYYVIVDHTKNYRDRKFPITEEIKDCIERIMIMHKKYFPDSKYLFPDKTGNKPIGNTTVYGFYRRMCKKLGIVLSYQELKGPHSFRRNGITGVTNKTNGNIILASELYGNTPNVAQKNYYAGIDLAQAKAILES